MCMHSRSRSRWSGARGVQLQNASAPVTCVSHPHPSSYYLCCVLKNLFCSCFPYGPDGGNKEYFSRSHISGVNQQMVRIFNCMSHKFSVESLSTLKSAYKLISVVGDTGMTQVHEALKGEKAIFLISAGNT